MVLARLLLPFVLFAVLASTATAQGLYKFRDEQGNWVFTDRPPTGARDVEELPRANAVGTPEITIAKRENEGHLQLVATNNCFCPAEVDLRWLAPAGVAPPPEGIHTVLPARRDTLLASIALATSPAAPAFGYEYRAVLGEPDASHVDSEAYRAPFAVSRTFAVSQAFPAQFTHADRSSLHAVDFVMPVGTQVYAARSGTVIEVASNYFESTDDPGKAMRANIVRVLHADGTMALYAHLNWDSIRVRPGQIVRRGEYIADSGNTGFTTGPHLHFVVQRNAGLHLESIPIVFAGARGARVIATTGVSLTAY